MKKSIYRDGEQAQQERIEWLREGIAKKQERIARLRADVLDERQLSTLEDYLARFESILAADALEEIAFLEEYSGYLDELHESIPLLAEKLRDDRALRVSDFMDVGEGAFVELSREHHSDEYFSDRYLQVRAALLMITSKVHLKTLVREASVHEETIWATFIVDGEQYYLTYESVTGTDKGKVNPKPGELTVHARVSRLMEPLYVEPPSLLNRVVMFVMRVPVWRPRTGESEFDRVFRVTGVKEGERHLTADLAAGMTALAGHDEPSLEVEDGMARVSWTAEPDKRSIRGAIKALRSLVHAEISVFEETE